MIGLVKRWFGREQVDAVAPVILLAAGDGLESCRAGISLYGTGDYAGAEGCLRQALGKASLAEGHRDQAGHDGYPELIHLHPALS